MQDISLTFIPIQATVSTPSFYYNILLKNYHPYSIHIFSKIFSFLFLLLTFFFVPIIFFWECLFSLLDSISIP